MMPAGDGVRKEQVPVNGSPSGVSRVPRRNHDHLHLERPEARSAAHAVAAGKHDAVVFRVARYLPRLAWFACVIVPFIAINIVGARYYMAPQSVRVRDALHPWLRPSGYIGQSAGILALVVFLFLWLYPLRKKWKALAFTGTIGKWLEIHIAAALSLPFLLAIHSGWHSDGLIGLGLTAMLVVIASGVVGRYLYARIPRAKDGVELTREEVALERRRMIENIAAATRLGEDAVQAALDLEIDGSRNESPPRVIWRLLTNDITRWKRVRELRRRWVSLAPDSHPLARSELRQAVRIADREISMAQQARMLDATQRVFRYWHVAHRPFAITALLAVTIHVAVVVAVGATWFH